MLFTSRCERVMPPRRETVCRRPPREPLAALMPRDALRRAIASRYDLRLDCLPIDALMPPPSAPPLMTRCRAMPMPHFSNAERLREKRAATHAACRGAPRLLARRRAAIELLAAFHFSMTLICRFTLRHIFARHCRCCRFADSHCFSPHYFRFLRRHAATLRFTPLPLRLMPISFSSMVFTLPY